MNDTDTRVTNPPQSDEAGPNITRLLGLGRWLTEEERARRLGKPSHWNQGVWVQTDVDDVNDLPVEILGVADGPQPQLVRWSCGTAACAAGRVAIEDGGAPAFEYDGETRPVPPPGSDEDLWTWLEALSSSRMFFGGRLETIEEHSQQALGLDAHQASLLFHGDNTWSEMVDHISRLTEIPEGQLLVLIGGTDMPADPDEDEEYEDSGR